MGFVNFISFLLIFTALLLLLGCASRHKSANYDCGIDRLACEKTKDKWGNKRGFYSNETFKQCWCLSSKEFLRSK